MMDRNSYKSGFIPYALAAFMVGIVGGFSAVLGPAFVADLGIGYQNATWTALATAMSAAACAPILGKLGDVIGRRTTLLLGIGVFTLGNILTALAPSLLFMLATRFIVGIGTAAIGPVVLSYIITEFPEDALAKGFSLYMLISSAAVIFGPVLGGLLISAAGWRAMVWVCVAICAVTFLACLATCGKDTGKRKPLKDFDFLGAVLVLIFFSLVLCIPSFGQNFGWTSAPFLIILAASAFALAALAAAERRAVHPILPGSFMRRRTFILSVLALLLTQGLMQANMTNIIVFVELTQPRNTIISSLAISIMYLGMALGAVVLGPLADRWETKTVLTGAMVLTGIGCALMLLFSENTPPALLVASLGILGFGLGGDGTILMKAALSGLSPEAAGAGTGTYGLFRDIAAPFGVAVFVPMFTNRITRETAGLTAAGLGETAAAAAAAVTAMRSLAVAELLCVAGGIVCAQLLPRRQRE